MATMTRDGVYVCPNCGSIDIETQLFQENVGSVTKTKGKSKYKEKRHSVLWWIVFGWWWWIVDLCIWVWLFIPRALLHIGRKRDYTGKSSSVSKTKNEIKYKTMCLCKSCGHNWER